MGFGMEMLFVLMLALLILGPKRLHTMLVHLARTKAELQNATRGPGSQLAAELDAARGHGKFAGPVEAQNVGRHSKQSLDGPAANFVHSAQWGKSFVGTLSVRHG